MVVFCLILFCLKSLAITPLEWVGIYKGKNTENVVGLDKCDEKGCNFSFIKGPYPTRLYADCPTSYTFKKSSKALVFNFTDVNDDKQTVKIKKNSSGAFHLSNFSLHPEFAKNPSCTLKDDIYEEIYHSPPDAELEALLPICKNLNNHIWVRLCRAKEHREYLKFYLKESRIQQDDFLKSIDQSEDLVDFLSSKIIGLYEKDIPKSKVLKELPFQGLYETQKLSFHHGLNNWHTILTFNNCKNNDCEFVSKHCEGMSYGFYDCRTTTGEATFESEDKIFINDICEDKRLRLKKIDGKWDVDPKGCNEFPFQPEKRNDDEINTKIYEAGYNCLQRKLTTIENTICRSKILSSYDKWLNLLIKKQTDKSGQLQWLKERNSCIDKDVELCLNNNYEKRILKFLLQVHR